MKRTVAFLAAVCLSSIILSAGHARAQAPSQTPPPPASDAAGDTVKTQLAPPPAPPVAPPKAQVAAPPDTLSAAAKARRTHMTQPASASYIFSFGVGSAHNYAPDDINNHFSPSFGGMLSFGVKRYGVVAGINMNYNFFLAQGTAPNDLNIFTLFAELKYSPLKSQARPYIVACGGYYRQWIVDLDYTESVLGFGGGAGVEMEIDRTRRLFLDARYIEGQTRQIEPNVNSDQSNTATIPVRLGISWEFK